MNHHELVQSYRRVAQQVLADHGLDPADAYRLTPDQINAAVERAGERPEFDIRQLLRKEGWQDDDVENLELVLATQGYSINFTAGYLPYEPQP